MRTHLWQIANSIAIVVLIVALLWKEQTHTRVAYIQSATLLEKYKGMHDARALLRQKVTMWNEEVTKSRNAYNKALGELTANRDKHNTTKLREKAEALSKSLNEQIANLERNSRTAEETVIQGALNQMNQFIEDYSKREDYELVLGVTLDGNILYGSEVIDITQQVLTELNARYTSGQ